MNPFQSLRDYEEFIYTLGQQFPTPELPLTEPNLPFLIHEIEQLVKD